MLTMQLYIITINRIFSMKFYILINILNSNKNLSQYKYETSFAMFLTITFSM